MMVAGQQDFGPVAPDHTGEVAAKLQQREQRHRFDASGVTAFVVASGVG
jgi:hypothetical protein